MDWQQLIIEIYQRIAQVLETALNGLTIDELNYQPDPDCNSMGWLAWHLTRSQDRAIASLSGEDQLWLKDKWHDRFNRPAAQADTGFGHSPEDITAFKSPDARTLMEYHRAVLEQTKRFLGDLPVKELGRELDNPKVPTVGLRLVGVISDNLQHAGQIAYLRGLLKGKGWLET